MISCYLLTEFDSYKQLSQVTVEDLRRGAERGEGKVFPGNEIGFPSHTGTKYNPLCQNKITTLSNYRQLSVSGKLFTERCRCLFGLGMPLFAFLFVFFNPVEN